MDPDPGFMEIELEPMMASGDAQHVTLGRVLRGDKGRKLQLWGWVGALSAGLALVLAIALAAMSPGKCSSLDPVIHHNDAVRELSEFVASTIDPAADPCDDFYQFACGGWMEDTEIPSDRTGVSLGFSVLSDLNTEELIEILEEDWPVIGPFYRACMDTAQLDAAGTAPLLPMLALIDSALADDAPPAAAYELAGKLRRRGVGFLLASGVYADERDPTRHSIYMSTQLSGLPDRDYYLDAGHINKTIGPYKAHIARMLGFAGVPAAEAGEAAGHIVEVETMHMAITLPRAELRDPEKTYNKYTVAELDVLAGPDVSIAGFLAAWGVSNGTIDPAALHVIVAEPETFKQLAAHVAALDRPTLRYYAKWRVMTSWADTLSRELREEDFGFYSKELYGVEEMRARNKTCAYAADGWFSDIVNRYWVAQHFPPAAKAEAVDMVERIEGEFERLLPDVAWMDAPTREAARQKLSLMSNLIGYPDKWEDMSSLHITSASYFDNTYAVAEFDVEKTLRKVSKPVDRTEWFMTPSEVNAYYDPTFNQMVFPAGIIQPTFFKHEYPTSFNYGGIGAVMGHELSHGFDDEGRRYDGTGKLTDWWPESVVKSFEEHASCVARQYSALEVRGSANGGAPLGTVNGNLTLGENLADTVGVKLAYRAFLRRAAERKAAGGGADPPVHVAARGGVKLELSPEKLFFVSYAESWCGKYRDEAAADRLLTDPHSPAVWRVNAVLRNQPEFAAAWGCIAGADGMAPAPEDVCTVW